MDLVILVLCKVVIYILIGVKMFEMESMFVVGEVMGVLIEVGVFNVVVVGIMLDCVVFVVINKFVDDVLMMCFMFMMS